MAKLTKREMKDNLDDPHWWDENVWGPTDKWVEDEEELNKCTECARGTAPEWEDWQEVIAMLVRKALFGNPKRVTRRTITTPTHPYLARCDITGEAAGCNHEECT